MRREHFIEETPQPGDELIFYCDCNNNVTDKVSNLDLWQLIAGGASSWAPLYVVDPSDSSRCCVMKRSGAYRVPCVIGDYRGDTKYNYIIAKSQAYSDESTKRFLASPTYGNHKVSFYWYCGMTTVGGCIFDYSGLCNNNANQNNSGIALIGLGSNVLFRAKNNSSTALDTLVGSRSALKDKWYYVEMTFYYVSPTQYSVSFLPICFEKVARFVLRIINITASSYYDITTARQVLTDFRSQSKKAMQVYDTYSAQILTASTIEAIDTLYNQAIAAL